MRTVVGSFLPRAARAHDHTCTSSAVGSRHGLRVVYVLAQQRAAVPKRYGSAVLREPAAEFAFLFADAEGIEIENRFELPHADWPADTPDMLSRSGVHHFPFVGPPLGNEEEIYLNIISDSAKPGELPRPAPDALEAEISPRRTKLGRATEVGATGVDLETSVLTELGNGPVTMQWTRIARRKLQNATPAGGAFRGQYFSRSRQFTLTD